MSFIYSRALVEASLQANCLDVDAYAQLNLSHTLKPCLLHDKTTERFPLSRFGMTCEPLTESHGKALLTWWREDSRARISVQPEAGQESKASEAGFGQKWSGSFAKYNQEESSWKTPQYLLLGGSGEFLETWPRWGSMRSGESFLRPIPALPICESASGLWPTPTRRDYRSDKCTPEVKAARDAHPRGKTLPWVLGGLLNPEWTEWLMGWPIGHTALEPLEMDKYQEWRQQHSLNYQEK